MLEHFLTDEAEYWIAFSRIEAVGAQRLKKIKTHFSSMEEAWTRGTFQDFLDARVENRIANQIVEKRTSIDPNRELALLRQDQISLISYLDSNYPVLLKEIPDHPAILFCRGNLDLLRERFPIGVVGTRKMTSYGKEATHKIVNELAHAGFTIVSGMAMGIDGEAHTAALGSNGKTIAVIASGVDDESIYPRIHYNLGKRIIEEGLLISEFPPGTKPRDFYFPFRNRIIAGLSKGVIIIEAPEKSGTLLTANYALEYNRDVFAVPNSIFSMNAAVPNSLLKKGAVPIEGADDVLKTFELESNIVPTPQSAQTPESEEETLLLQILTDGEVHIDDLIRVSKLDTQKVSVTLTLMEMKGMVKRLEGMYFRKI